MLICNHAGKFDHCNGCQHSKKHESTILFEYCLEEGNCCSPEDGSIVSKVKCVEVPNES
jgi:hypothetical protein